MSKKYVAALGILSCCSLLFLLCFAPPQDEGFDEVAALLENIETVNCRAASAAAETVVEQLVGQEGEKAIPPSLSAVCSRLPSGRTTASFWKSHTEEILQASMHPADEKGYHNAWMRELLLLLSSQTHLMERGLRSPLGMSVMERLVAKVGERFMSKQHNNSSSHVVPLQIAIFGGSVTEGAGCELVPAELKPFLPKKLQRKDKSLEGRQCAWPYRLQLLADAFLGPGTVQIHNLGAGGTNSNLSLPVLEYRLYPKEVLKTVGPDIIVNGYAVNDGLFSWHANANATGDLRHFFKTLGTARAFYETAIRSRPCPFPPTVVFVDEYFGNTHELLLGEDIRNDAVRLLADESHHNTNIGYVSSAFVARHFVYGNTNETLFSADWYLRRTNQTTGVYQVTRRKNPHFGLSAHQHVAWSIAYSSLRAVMDFCEDYVDYSSSPAALMDDGNENSGRLAGAPPKAPKEAIAAQRESCRGRTVVDATAPCSFAFVSSAAGTVKMAKGLNKYIAPFQTSSSNGGWFGANDMRNGWQNKLGLVPRRSRASIDFTVAHVKAPVRVLTIHSLKSYGEKWEESEALFNLTIWNEQGGLKYAKTFSLTGYHNESTSLTFPHTFDLGDKSAAIGETVGLSIALTGGTSFKITAIMMCSR